jgi:hypothetical protein
MAKLVKGFLVGTLFIAVFWGSSISNVADAAPSANYTDIHWLIDNPCRGWNLVDPGVSQPQVVCDGLFASDRASIKVPVPYINDRIPQYSLVDIPMVFQVGWMPGSFGWQDSKRRTIQWTDNRIEGYRVELGLSPDANNPTVVWSPVSDGNLGVYALDGRLKLYEKSHYADACASSSLAMLPKSLGGLDLCPTSAMEGLLKGDLLTGPPGNMLQRYAWGTGAPFNGGWFAGLSQMASVSGSGSDQGKPAMRVVFTTGWRLYARVQWDYHWKAYEKAVQYCGWEYYGQPGWYWDWTQWPPTCVDALETYWKKYCPPNNPQSGCPTITYGLSSDWWKSITGLEAHTIFVPGKGYQASLDIVVLQSQSLLQGP